MTSTPLDRSLGFSMASSTMLSCSHRCLLFAGPVTVPKLSSVSRSVHRFLGARRFGATTAVRLDMGLLALRMARVPGRKLASFTPGLSNALDCHAHRVMEECHHMMT